MQLDEINKITIPTINSFPHGKLFFDAENLLVESFSFDYTETAEFQKVNDITP